MDSPSLCIDLGASFTKIAVRIGINGTAHLLKDHSLLVGKGEEDNPFCFPSIAAHSIQGRSWVFGWEASDYCGSDDILILQDWKSVLFHEKYLDEFYDPAVDGDVDPVEIFLKNRDPYYIALACAQNYLKWLYQEQIPRLLKQDPDLSDYTVDDFETYVCVPDFVIGTGSGDTVDRFMEEAGFETPDSFLLSEPKSSLIGIITEGRNHLNDDGTFNQSVMFGDHTLLNRLKQPRDSIFFLDLGSFTTDMALANLSRFRSHHLSKAPAASYPLGLYKLDAMILSALPPEIANKVDLDNLPATERFHRTIYNEDGLTKFTQSDSISMTDGTEIPLSLIENCLDQFVSSVVAACRAFLNKYENGDIHAIVLTGGASIPSRISDRVVAGIEQLDFPLLRAHRNISAAKIPVDPIDQNLVRGASAIGGCSILYTPEEEVEEPLEDVVAEEVMHLFKTA